MKKFFFTLVLLVVFAAVVFYFGFLTIKIPSDKFGVLVTKTSGVYEKPVESSEFLWKWECVIPHNSSLILFDKNTRSYSKSLSGTLPSADIYCDFVYGNPDFSYSFEYEIFVRYNEQSIISLVKEGKITDEESLSVLTELYVDELSRQITNFIIGLRSSELVPSVIDMSVLFDELKIEQNYSDFVVENIFIKKSNFPDLNLYNSAKQSYADYQSSIDKKLEEYASLQAERIMSDSRAAQRLEQLGDVLKKYPELSELLSREDAISTINALNDLR